MSEVERCLQNEDHLAGAVTIMVWARKMYLVELAHTKSCGSSIKAE